MSELSAASSSRMANSVGKGTFEDPSAPSKKPSSQAAGGNRRRNNRGILPGIWSAKDRPGPAAWRRDSGQINGMVRRKGERDPKKTGFIVSRKIAEDSKYNLKTLPPLSSEIKAKMEQKKAAKEKKWLKAETVAKKAGSGRTRKSGDKGCEVM